MSDILETISEIFGWIRIVLSPLLIGAGLGAIIYYNYPTWTSFIIAILLGVLGLVIGVIWATRVWDKQGTIQFLSRVDASPDLDKKVDEKKD